MHEAFGASSYEQGHSETIKAIAQILGIEVLELWRRIKSEPEAGYLVEGNGRPQASPLEAGTKMCVSTRLAIISLG
jgi:hypothetical protein